MAGTPTTIAVGFDGSPDSEAAVRWAAALAAGTGAELVAVHAVGLLEHAGIDGRATAHRQTVERIADAAGVDPARVTWSVVDGDPCSAMLRVAGERPEIGLLVVGSRGAGRHHGSVLGSTSLELAERAHVPVTIVPTGRA